MSDTVISAIIGGVTIVIVTIIICITYIVSQYDLSEEFNHPKD